MSKTLLRQLEVGIGDLLERRQGRDTDFSAYADDPVGFIREVLREDDPGPWQAQIEIAQAVRDCPFVAVLGSNSSGKDWLAARLALWWVFARRGFCIITGPTQRQVQTIVMGEIHRAFHRARGLHGELFQMALRIDHEDEQRGILALTSTEASKLTGFHAPRLLTILTEAQAVEEFAWEGLLSCRTGENDRTLAVANPLSPEGRLYQVSEWPHWKTIHVPASTHPNVVEGRELIGGGPTRSWIEFMRREYGEGSSQFVSRVLARFPSQAEDSLIDKGWIDDAIARHDQGEIPEGTPWTLGLDPSGLGADESVLCLRRGERVVGFRSWRKLEAPELADEVMRVVIELLNTGEVADGAYPGPGIDALYVDSIGVGHGLVGILARRLAGVRYWVMLRRVHDSMTTRAIRVVGVSISRAPGDPQRFVRRKCELTWALREEFASGRISIPGTDEKLVEELAGVRMTTTPDGRMTTEAKERLRGRIGRSPDRLDALVLTLQGSVRDRKQKVVNFR